MAARVNGIGQIPNGALTDVGLSIMQLGMITGLHAAISPSFFTFACFAKKPAECKIAKKTLWISLIATTLTNVGILFAFKRWAPAITGQIVGTGLFVGGMLAVGSDEEAPANPTMKPQTTETPAPSPAPETPAPAPAPEAAPSEETSVSPEAASPAPAPEGLTATEETPGESSSNPMAGVHFDLGYSRMPYFMGSQPSLIVAERR